MVNNYIDMKQEMADRITQAWEYMCASAFRLEGEKQKTHMSSNNLEAKWQGARIALWSFTNVFALATTRKEVHVTLRDDSDWCQEWHPGMKNDDP